MLSVELKNLADVLDATGQLRNVSQLAKTWSSRVHDAILKTTVTTYHFIARLTSNISGFYRSWTTSMPTRPMVRPVHLHVFLLLILSLGFGGRYVMDDANVPVCELLPMSSCV